MHVAGSSSLDLNWFVRLIFTVFVIVLALLYLVKNTASKYFEVEASFEDRTASSMPGLRMDDASCIVCAKPGTKKCSRCKEVRYCSPKCQTEHWQSGHKTKCKVSPVQTAATNNGLKLSGLGAKNGTSVALVPGAGSSRHIKKPKEVLFPYEEFVKYFNWKTPGYTPCGLLNCGNSCFANVVLQCLTHTRPLVAYLLEKHHRRECKRNDWCFLCEFQTHVERASQSPQPFSPVNILSRLPNIGGNMGYGRQEDAHEFMRFAIDTMQSICLDEFGGEKAVPPSYQETTLIQHIFGGRLQSQVMCTKCNKISNQYENMMDLTVEIHGDVTTLEECLDQFTVKEWLHGENMYKCDGCNDYVKAWKRLTVLRASNILTIALKRFQSGRFGKLNKRVTFPETLDLGPYMSEAGDGTDIYTLYAVVVHVDMLNASYFGHYICYTKDFCGNWYRIDDCKVAKVDLDEVLSQGAYMLLYSRVCARASCLKTCEPAKEAIMEVDIPKEAEGFRSLASFIGSQSSSGSLSSDGGEHSELNSCGKDSLNSEDVREHTQFWDMGVANSSQVSPTKKGSICNGAEKENGNGNDVMNSKEIPEGERDSLSANVGDVDIVDGDLSATSREEAEPIAESNVPDDTEDHHANGHGMRAHQWANGLASTDMSSDKKLANGSR